MYTERLSSPFRVLNTSLNNNEIMTVCNTFPIIFYSTVNDAGLGMSGVLETIPVEKAKQLFEVVFFGAYRTMQAVLPHMKKEKSGLILNNSSLFGLVGAPFTEVYCAAKFALEGLTESLAPSLLHFDIR